MQVRHKKVWFLAAVLTGTCVFLSIALRSARLPLEVVSRNSKYQLSSIRVTEGTDHVYYYGKSLDFMASTVGRLTGANGSRMHCTTLDRSAVVWIRCDHPDYGIVPPSRPFLPAHFSAELINASGRRAPLMNVGYNQSFAGKFVAMGWYLDGTVDNHKGSIIRIQARNGEEAALLKVK